MKRLELALYAEGATDALFLPPVIQRTLEQLLENEGQDYVQIDVHLIPKGRVAVRQEECILWAARAAANFSLLIVHCDADHPTQKPALKDRFQPGYQLVQQSPEDICKSLVPIIPIRMTEAWMLAAEHDVFCKVLRTDKKPREL